jgi:hypothetical protein
VRTARRSGVAERRIEKDLAMCAIFHAIVNHQIDHDIAGVRRSETDDLTDCGPAYAAPGDTLGRVTAVATFVL